MPQATRTSSSDAATLLNIHSTHDRWFNCVGTTLKHERCKCQVARANVDEGMSLLGFLPRHPIASEDLQDKLEEIAEFLLCRRNHQYQAQAVANKWRNIIVAEHSRQSRLEAPRRSRRVQAQDSDRNSAEVRARERRRLDEQRAEQLQRGECPICYTAFKTPCETACTHIFCYDCVAPWVQRHGNCPSCRAQATVHELLMVEELQERTSTATARRIGSDREVTATQRSSIASRSPNSIDQLFRPEPVPTSSLTFTAGSRSSTHQPQTSTSTAQSEPARLPASAPAPAPIVQTVSPVPDFTVVARRLPAPRERGAMSSRVASSTQGSSLATQAPTARSDSPSEAMERTPRPVTVPNSSFTLTAGSSTTALVTASRSNAQAEVVEQPPRPMTVPTSSFNFTAGPSTAILSTPAPAHLPSEAVQQTPRPVTPSTSSFNFTAGSSTRTQSTAERPDAPEESSGQRPRSVTAPTSSFTFTAGSSIATQLMAARPTSPQRVVEPTSRPVTSPTSSFTFTANSGPSRLLTQEAGSTAQALVSTSTFPPSASNARAVAPILESAPEAPGEAEGVRSARTLEQQIWERWVEIFG